MSGIILVVWTVTAMAGTQISVYKEYGWKPIGEFNSVWACKAAGAELGFKSNEIRCLQK